MTRFALAAALLAALASPARADDELRPDKIPAKARQLAERGRAFHDAGDYGSAIAAFQEAYVLAPSPGLLFNLAQAYRLAGNCADAAWMYHRFLDTNPRTDQRALAEAHLQTVEQCSHAAVAPEVTQIATVAPAPPPHVTELAIADASAGSRERRIGIAFAIGGGAALAAAGLFALDAHEAASTVSATYKNGGKWSDVAGTNARGERDATLAKVFGIGGALVVASGATMYLLGRHAEHVVVTPTSRGAGIGVTWGF